MKLFKRRPTAKHEIPPHVEEKIRDGLRNWIDNHLYREPGDSIDKLAERINVSTVQLSDYMRDNLCIKYRSLRRILRIRDAKILLLLYYEQSNAQIGNIIGITDSSDFRKQFRKATGCTPNKWRERINIRNKKFRKRLLWDD